MSRRQSAKAELLLPKSARLMTIFFFRMGG